MTFSPVRPTALLLLAALAASPVAANVPAAETAPAPAVTAAELPVPRPDVSHLSGAVQARLAELQDRATELLAQDPLPGDELTILFGFLGQMLEAFALFDAAEQAFANAARLSDDFMWQYYLGLTAHSKGDFPAAVAGYRETLERSPGYTAARIRLGDALLELGRLDEAAAAYRSVLETEPENPSALRGAGETALRAGDADAAVGYLERALAVAPGADSLHYPLAQAYRRQGKADLARRHLALQGEKRPPLDDPLGNSITTLGNTMAFEVAQELAEEESFSERNFLGFVHSRLGDLPLAPQQLDQMVKQLTESDGRSDVRGRLRWAQAAILAARGEWEAAEGLLVEAVTLAPGLVEAHVLLADARARSGRFEEALDAYSRAIGLDADHREARVRRAGALTRLGRFDAALTDLRTLQERFPDDVELRLHEASVLEQSGQPDEARALYRQVAEEGRTRQERARGHLAMAAMAQRGGDAEAAEAAYRAARELDPDAVAAVAGEARLLATRGQYSEAADLYLEAVELEPRSEEQRRAAAAALILADRHAAVVPLLEEGLLLLPESLALRELLARHLAASPDPTTRDGARAVALAEEVYAAKPAPVTMETLAMAHAQAGDFARAIEWQERLLETAEEYQGTSEYYRLRANLELYRQGRPCCATP